MNIKKIILALFAVGILFLTNITPAFACSCTPPVSPKESLRNSTAVFAGKVIDIDIPGWMMISSADPVRITFEVSSVWKGGGYKTIMVETARSEASCGYSFTKDEEYLVYARGEEADLKVGLCGRTKLLADADEDLNVLSQGNIPTIEKFNEPYNSNFFIFGILMSVVIIILISRRYIKNNPKFKL